MNTFKDLKIETDNSFIGEKISPLNLIDVSIMVHAFKIEPSKRKVGTDFLTLQIDLSGIKRITFSGSKFLMKQIKMVPDGKFPFQTTIVRKDGHLEFT